MTDKTPAMPKLPDPFAYLCDWGNDSYGLTRQVVYYGEPGSATLDDWNEYPKVRENEPIYTADQMRAALQSAQPAAAVSDDDILAAAHRLAWRYKHSSDPAHSSTYTFNSVCLLQFARAILALRPQAVPMTPEPGDLPCGESSSDSHMSNCLGMGLHVCNDCSHGITAQGAGAAHQPAKEKP